MKKSIFTCIAMAILFLSACKKDSSTAAPITTANVSSTVASGTWRVTYYWDTDHDETANFTGYAFTFGSGNVLTATKAATSLTGTWATDTDDAQVKLIVAFSSPVNFAKISDDWHVTERTDTKIKLEDVSGGASGTDYLTFEKN